MEKTTQSLFVKERSILNRAPEEYHYSLNHQWAHVEENSATIGVTAFVLNWLGEVLYLDLPEEGDRVQQREVFGSMESVANMFDLIAPVSGTVTAVNYSLIENPGRMNDDPFGEGWLLQIELESEKDLAELIRAPEYLKMIASQKGALG